jgi:hypothetical protein
MRRHEREDAMSGARALRRLSRRAASVESLERDLAQLVMRRQELRAAGASDGALERNRRRIVRVQREIAHALIAGHRAAADRSAA